MGMRGVICKGSGERSPEGSAGRRAELRERRPVVIMRDAARQNPRFGLHPNRPSTAIRRGAGTFHRRAADNLLPATSAKWGVFSELMVPRKFPNGAFIEDLLGKPSM